MHNLIYAQLQKVYKDSKWGYADKQGNIKISHIYDDAGNFDFEWLGLAKVNRDGKDYLLDTTGTEYLLTTELDNITNETEALDLSRKFLTEIPDVVFNYPQIKILLLTSNNLSTLPANIDSLPNIFYLDLQTNQLSSIPKQIGNLSNLKVLYVGSNKLSDLPSEIGNLSNLSFLDLSYNKIANLPNGFGNLSKLTVLYLNRNNLTRLPNEIGNLSNLSELDLSHNKIRNLPSNIGNLTNLSKLYIWNNELQELPSEIKNMINLSYLDLQYNQLTNIPIEIGNLSNLKYLDVQYNQLNYLPIEIGNLTKLEDLELSSNNITTLPVEFTNLTNLKNLNLNTNKDFNFPEGIEKLTKLKNLSLLDCNINQIEQNIIKRKLPNCRIIFDDYTPIFHIGISLGVNYKMGNNHWLGGEISLINGIGKNIYNPKDYFSISALVIGYNYSLGNNINDIYFNAFQINKYRLFNLQFTKVGFYLNPIWDAPKWYYQPSIGLSYRYFSVSYSYNLMFDETLRNSFETHLFEAKITYPIYFYWTKEKEF